VDWFGINVFSTHPRGMGGGATRSGPSDACITGFISQAESKGFPVMLGESTPRMMGAANEPPQLLRAASGGCLGFDFASAALPGAQDRAALSLMACNASGDSQAWRLTDEGYLLSAQGMCVSGASGAALAGDCVPPPHHHVCRPGGPGCSGLLWKHGADGSLSNGDGLCLAAKAPGGGVTVGRCSKAADQRWAFAPSEVADHRGGESSWQRWFEPYLALIARPAVKAFCYSKCSSLPHIFVSS